MTRSAVRRELLMLCREWTLDCPSARERPSVNLALQSGPSDCM